MEAAYVPEDRPGTRVMCIVPPLELVLEPPGASSASVPDDRAAEDGPDVETSVPEYPSPEHSSFGSKVRTPLCSDSCTSSLPLHTSLPIPLEPPPPPGLEPSASPSRTSPRSDEVPSTNAAAAAGSSKDSLCSLGDGADASSAARPKRAGDADGGASRPRRRRRDLAIFCCVLCSVVLFSRLRRNSGAFPHDQGCLFQQSLSPSSPLCVRASELFQVVASRKLSPSRSVVESRQTRLEDGPSTRPRRSNPHLSARPTGRQAQGLSIGFRDEMRELWVPLSSVLCLDRSRF